jgi:hypothetical protein
MKNLIFILALMLLTAVAANATDTVRLNEDLLYKLLKESPPTIQKLEASFLGEDISRAKAEDLFAPIISARAKCS